MNDVIKMKTRWEALHLEPRFRPRYPHEEVVRWGFRSFQRDGDTPPSILDLGCGAGRHAMFFAREGFDVSACDISQTGVDETRILSAANGLAMNAHCCTAHELGGYNDATFDGAVCFGVYCYMTLDEISTSVQHVHRMLKPGGQFMCVTRNDGDARAVGATLIGDHRYQLADLSDAAPSNAEAGMQMTFLHAAEIERLFACFDEVEVVRMTFSRMDGQFTDDDWIIYARKAG
jgi:2-polyprenyl-3-methyl-5-hydroxy-6-metoxy-1,4-benzoquinol methylase